MIMQLMSPELVEGSNGTSKEGSDLNDDPMVSETPGGLDDRSERIVGLGESG